MASYCGWTALVRSWFWRYYDNLFVLIFLNLGWFVSGLAVFRIFLWAGRTPDLRQPHFLEIYLLYLAECAVALPWAYPVFRIFNEGMPGFRDLWKGLLAQVPKALGAAALWGAGVGAAVYNIFFYFFLHSAHRFLDFFLMGLVFWVLLFLLTMGFYLWPLVFFQNPPFPRIFYRSFLLALANGGANLASLLFLGFCAAFFSFFLFLWFFMGPVFFFAFQCVALEKHLLRYKIIYRDEPLEPFLERLEHEKDRGWRDFFKPWENR